MVEHEGHDADLSHENECPCCAEVVTDFADHVCHDMAWARFTRHMTVTHQEDTP